MSMDSEPVPGRPLLDELFCFNVTVKGKTSLNCTYPESYYTKESLFSGPAAVGIGCVEVVLLTIFWFLSSRMKNDPAKAFLTSVYLPLSFATLFKIMCGGYGIVYRKRKLRFWFYAYQTLYNVGLTTANLCAAMGTVFYLSTLIVIARRRRNFAMQEIWDTYWSILLVSVLLSSSYHFVDTKWTGLQCAAIFFVLVVAAIGFFILFITAIFTIVGCSGSQKQSDGSEDPVVYDARTRIGWALLSLTILNVPSWVQIANLSVEQFTPYLWNGDEHKKRFYSGQAAQLLIFDISRMAWSFVLLKSMFFNAAIYTQIMLLLSTKKSKKIFVGNQTAPLLAYPNANAAPTPQHNPASRPSAHGGEFLFQGLTQFPPGLVQHVQYPYPHNQSTTNPEHNPGDVQNHPPQHRGSVVVEELT